MAVWASSVDNLVQHSKNQEMCDRILSCFLTTDFLEVNFNNTNIISLLYGYKSPDQGYWDFCNTIAWLELEGIVSVKRGKVPGSTCKYSQIVRLTPMGQAIIKSKNKAHSSNRNAAGVDGCAVETVGDEIGDGPCDEREIFRREFYGFLGKFVDPRYA